jgi:hypothetical protein
MTDKQKYTAVCQNGRWMIEVNDEDGDTFFMTCGLTPSETEVQARIRFLLLDDDQCDAADGHPRKYQVKRPPRNAGGGTDAGANKYGLDLVILARRAKPISTSISQFRCKVIDLTQC